MCGLVYAREGLLWPNIFGKNIRHNDQTHLLRILIKGVVTLVFSLCEGPANLRPCG
jgi:hypothetical protein